VTVSTEVKIRSEGRSRFHNGSYGGAAIQGANFLDSQVTKEKKFSKGIFVNQTCYDVLVTAEDGDGNVRPANVPDVEAEVKQLGTAGQVIGPLRPPLHTSRRRYRLHREDRSVDVALVGT